MSTCINLNSMHVQKHSHVDMFINSCQHASYFIAHVDMCFNTCQHATYTQHVVSGCQHGPFFLMVPSGPRAPAAVRAAARAGRAAAAAAGSFLVRWSGRGSAKQAGGHSARGWGACGRSAAPGESVSVRREERRRRIYWLLTRNDTR